MREGALGGLGNFTVQNIAGRKTLRDHRKRTTDDIRMPAENLGTPPVFVEPLG